MTKGFFLMATKDPIYPNQSNPEKTGRWGEIDKFVPQSSPSYMDANSTDHTLTQVFKGPSFRLEDLQIFLDAMLQANSQTNKTLHYFMNNSGSVIQWQVGEYVAGAPMYTVMFPMSEQGKEWVIDSYSIEECNPAGLMCIFRVKFKKVQEEDGEDSDPDYTYWSCNMQASQIDVLAYCSNRPKDGVSGTPGEEDGGTYATRIQTWYNQPTDTSFLKPKYKFQSIVGAGREDELNDAEKAIAKKLEAGKSPLRHYPVIVKNQVYSGKPKINFDLIDRIVTETQMNRGLKSDERNPFDLDGWEWLCTGINSEYNTQTQTTRVSTEYTGAFLASGAAASGSGWDKDFYGPDRWEFGEVFE